MAERPAGMSQPSNGQKCTRGAEPLADEAQPGNAGMGGFRHRSLHVEVKDRFRAAGALLGQAPPAGIAHARRAVADGAVAHEIDIGVAPAIRPASTSHRSSVPLRRRSQRSPPEGVGRTSPPAHPPKTRAAISGQSFASLPISRLANSVRAWRHGSEGVAIARAREQRNRRAPRVARLRDWLVCLLAERSYDLVVGSQSSAARW